MENQSRTLLIVVGALVLIVLVGLVGYYAVNKRTVVVPEGFEFETAPKGFVETPQEFGLEGAEWKIYENKERGFSFKYPNDWELESGKDFFTLISPATKQDLVNCGPPCEFAGSTDISFFYYPSIGEEPTNIQYKLGAKTIDELITKDETKRKLGTRSISGVTAVEFEQGGAGATYNLYIQKAGHIYVITFGLHEKSSDLSLIENQILATFQFTK